MKAIWLSLLGAALLAGSAAGASKGTAVKLVPYSTSKDAYGKIISAFQQSSAGLGVAVPDVPEDHAAGDPLGGRLRRRPQDGPGDRRVRRGQRRLGPHRGQDGDAAALRAGALRGVRHAG